MPRIISIEDVPVYAHHTCLVANLYGQSVGLALFRQNRRPSAACASYDEVVMEAEHGDWEIVRQRLRAAIVAAILRYQQSGRFTLKELLTIYRLWLENRTLREIADMEGVKPESIRQRIEGNKRGHGGIRKKAPEFYRWWRFKNRNRRRIKP